MIGSTQCWRPCYAFQKEIEAREPLLCVSYATLSEENKAETRSFKMHYIPDQSFLMSYQVWGHERRHGLSFNSLKLPGMSCKSQATSKALAYMYSPQTQSAVLWRLLNDTHQIRSGLSDWSSWIPTWSLRCHLPPLLQDRINRFKCHRYKTINTGKMHVAQTGRYIDLGSLCHRLKSVGCLLVWNVMLTTMMTTAVWVWWYWAAAWKDEPPLDSDVCAASQ